MKKTLFIIAIVSLFLLTVCVPVNFDGYRFTDKLTIKCLNEDSYIVEYGKDMYTFNHIDTTLHTYILTSNTTERYPIIVDTCIVMRCIGIDVNPKNLNQYRFVFNSQHSTIKLVSDYEMFIVGDMVNILTSKESLSK